MALYDEATDAAAKTDIAEGVADNLNAHAFKD